jgi:hypothetical protein
MDTKTWKRITGISFFGMLVCLLASFYVSMNYKIPDTIALSHQSKRTSIPRVEPLGEGQLVPFDSTLVASLGGLPMQLSINGQAHDGRLVAEIMHKLTAVMTNIINERMNRKDL